MDFLVFILMQVQLKTSRSCHLKPDQQKIMHGEEDYIDDGKQKSLKCFLSNLQRSHYKPTPSLLYLEVNYLFEISGLDWISVSNFSRMLRGCAK